MKNPYLFVKLQLGVRKFMSPDSDSSPKNLGPDFQQILGKILSLA